MNHSRWFGALEKCCIVAIMFAAYASCMMAQTVSFPGSRSESKSPDGHFVIKNSDNDLEDPAHTLTLVDTRKGSVLKIYQYGRGVDILWSPTSDAFIINDHEGSNVSHPILFRVPWSAKSVDLREKLIDYLPRRNQARSVLENHHVYFTAERWLSDNEILCKVTGHGDVNPKGFTKYYLYELGGGFRPQP